MRIFDPPELLAADPDACIEALVHALRNGYLSLFIGAGISMSTRRSKADPFLFPSWGDLVAACCKTVGLPFDAARARDNGYLLDRADQFELECRKSKVNREAIEVLEKVLYANVSTYNSGTLKMDLLIALGSLTMSSLRGAASVVISYNYDDLLEWYLQMHGLTVTVVSDLPTIIPKADVAIYHPHGFVPKMAHFSQLKSKRIVFSKRSYQEIIAKNDSWNAFQKAVFGSTVALFVGMSGDDFHVETLFTNTYDQLGRKRIIGFMLQEDSPENREKEERYRDRGLVSLYYNSHDDLPDYLLDICQRAAGFIVP